MPHDPEATRARREAGYWREVIAARPDAFMADNAARGAAQVKRATRHLRYDAHSRQQVILWTPAGGGPAPLVAMFHGGYWQAGEPAAVAFAAADWTERGYAYAALGYRLLADAPFAEIRADAVKALATVARDPGVDADRIGLVGHSAGAHLAAYAALAQPPRALALLSGVYVLDPLVGTTPGDALDAFDMLDQDAAVPTLVQWGAGETRAFRAQSRWLTRRRRRAGLSTWAEPIAGADHYSVLAELERDGGLARFLIQTL